MSKKQSQAAGNAKTALQELMSPFGFKSEPAVATPAPATVPVSTPAPVQAIRPERVSKEKGAPPVKEVEKPIQREVPRSAPAAKPSIISAGSEITGSFRSKGDMTVEGTILGDTASAGKLTVSGVIKGNIEAESLEILGGRIEAESVKVKTDVHVQDGAEIIGNIQCTNLVFNGKIKGSLTVSNKCEIQPLSVIEGDVQAKELSMQPGATLIGRVSVTTAKSAQ